MNQKKTETLTPVTSPPESVTALLREESEAAAKARVMINHLRKGWSEEEACFAAELYADRYYY